MPRHPPSPNAARRGGSPTMGILKGISPLLSPELLYVLRSAGHRDVIAIVDANFPAVSNAVKTTHQKVVSMAGATLRGTDAYLCLLGDLGLDDVFN